MYVHENLLATLQLIYTKNTFSCSDLASSASRFSNETFKEAYFVGNKWKKFVFLSAFRLVFTNGSRFFVYGYFVCAFKVVEIKHKFFMRAF